MGAGIETGGRLMRRQHPPLWGELTRLQARLNELFEEALVGAGEELHGEGAAGCWRPVCDLVETPEAFVVVAELPGVEREGVKLEVQGHWLELSGERQLGAGEHSFVRLEGCHGPFRRRLELPQAVDPERITASLTRGLLEVTLPKRRPSGGKVEIREG